MNPTIASAALLQAGTVLCPTPPVESAHLPSDQSDTPQAEDNPAEDER